MRIKGDSKTTHRLLRILKDATVLSRRTSSKADLSWTFF